MITIDSLISMLVHKISMLNLIDSYERPHVNIENMEGLFIRIFCENLSKLITPLGRYRITI